MKHFAILMLAAVAAIMPAAAQRHDGDKVVVAYLTAGKDVMPDPATVTHVNYAFGHVNKTFDGLDISNPERLRRITAMKKDAPEMKVMLSVGGWGSGRFSEMADTAANRQAFARACAEAVKDFGLDGIDIDWEYPGVSSAGISSCERDSTNFTLLMRDLREALGNGRLLTLASPAGARHIDFRGVLPYVDFVNVMAYDIDVPPMHHAALFKSENTPYFTCETSIQAHIDAGVPAGMLVLGMPFYGRGGEEMRTANFKDIKIPEGYKACFDEKAMVPYITNPEGKLVMGYDDARSLTAKCRYIVDKGLHGGMYWEYGCDDEAGTLRNTVADVLLRGK